VKKGILDYSTTTSQKILFTQMINFEDGSECEGIYFFQTRVDAVRKVGLSPLQKCIAALCMLAYGVSADNVDDYVRIGESAAVECLERFVIEVYTMMYHNA
jgi:hypothetical protein